MKQIKVTEITQAVAALCISANLELSPEMQKCISAAKESEDNPLAIEILGQLEENMKIAKEDKIPICQDTGMAVFFVEVGQEVHIEGGSITDAINSKIVKTITNKKCSSLPW